MPISTNDGSSTVHCACVSLGVTRLTKNAPIAPEANPPAIDYQQFAPPEHIAQPPGGD